MQFQNLKILSPSQLSCFCVCVFKIGILKLAGCLGLMGSSLDVTISRSIQSLGHFRLSLAFICPGPLFCFCCLGQYLFLEAGSFCVVQACPKLLNSDNPAALDYHAAGTTLCLASSLDPSLSPLHVYSLMVGQEHVTQTPSGPHCFTQLRPRTYLVLPSSLSTATCSPSSPLRLPGTSVPENGHLPLAPNQVRLLLCEGCYS